MNVVHVSKTALAAAPYEIVKCLNKYTDLRVRWIAHRTRYADGRVFPSDILWSQERECQEVLNSADIIHIHNEFQPVTPGMLRGRKVLVQLHSIPKRSETEVVRRITEHIYTISQPLQIREYGLPGLPNLIDPREYTPLPKANDIPLIVFAPTNGLPDTVAGSKAKDFVCRVLDTLAGKAQIDVFSTLNYEQNLQRKRNADIIIDDIINETFHRTSLEAACFGVAVVNNVHNPCWIYADKTNLKEILLLVLNDIDKLRNYQRMSRQWILEHWHPEELCQKYVEAYEKMI